VLAGETQVLFGTLASTIAYISAGRLHALATAGVKRSKVLPELPTVAESGYPGFEAGVWYALSVPGATPRRIAERIRNETLKALRIKHPSQKLWAVFEPRTQSTRRNVFQNDFPTAFGEADEVIIAEVAFANVLTPEERLDTTKLETDLKANGKRAQFLPDVDTIVHHLGQQAQGGDVICVFSNGGFGNIHAKLLERLGKR